jgi:dihydrofolate synthase / folylpolyglutamate synthase
LRLEQFLSSKPLFYKKFDPLRMHKAYASIKTELPRPRIVHLIGTNGKGSTGRYLADMLCFADISVGHYTSPHIKNFNERIWIDGNHASDKVLDDAFDALMLVLPMEYQESLSYFEFTTLVAMFAFKNCDIVVLEAGLGGEFDATSVFENELTLLTPIGLDHAEFLGSTLREVAQTKIRGVQTKVISAPQENIVEDILKTLSDERHFKIEPLSLNSDDKQIVKAFSQDNEADYLVRNFKHALCALRSLGFHHKVKVGKIETLFGRLSKINDHIRVDVGHNLLAAKAILKFYGNSKVNLVYNSLEDKAYKDILSLLKPMIKKLYVIEISDERAVDKKILQTTLEELEIDFEPFEGIIDKENYLVFGSFVVVEAFLTYYDEIK